MPSARIVFATLFFWACLAAIAVNVFKQSSARGVLGFLCVVPAYYFARGVARHDDNRPDARAKRLKTALQEAESDVEALIQSAIDTSGQALIDLAANKTAYQAAPKERVYWSGHAEAWAPRTKRVNMTGVGTTISFRVAKGVRFRLGKSSLAPVPVKQLTRDGVGQLVITSRRIQFIPNSATGSSWSKTWGSIVSWNVTSDAIVVVLTSGLPRTFVIAVPDQDAKWQNPLIVACSMELASNAREEVAETAAEESA